jgi:L-ascorbate metabolism protein UlaG (beta-lactamase superfamily)
VIDPRARPARVFHNKMGGAFGVLVEAQGTRFYHNGRADLVDAELQSLDADVLLVGLAGRYATRDYLRRLIRLLHPRVIVPTHHDQFFAPLEAGVRLLPGVALHGFLAESRDLSPSSRVFTPTYDDELRLPERGDPRDAVFVPWG